MADIPRTAHYVFGLKNQTTAFHILHYLAIESCRQTLKPEKIFLYYHNLPYGFFWDLIRPHLTLVRVDPAPEVLAASYDEQLVPAEYRYAHHADVIRLDALLEHGGIYADIDTLFLQPIPEALYHRRFVISREDPVRDEISHELKPSLCNAVMMAKPASKFVREWRSRIGAAINGTWSNHSCFLAQALSEEFPDEVHVEPARSFLGVPLTPQGITALLEGGNLDLSASYCIHLWQHVWWSEDRHDFSKIHAGDLTLEHLQTGDTPLCRLVAPFMPEVDLNAIGPSAR